MSWYNNIGDLAGDVGHGLEELLGQRGQGMNGGPMGPVAPGMPGGFGPGQLPPGLTPNGADTGLTAMPQRIVPPNGLQQSVVDRVTGGAGGAPGQGGGDDGSGGFLGNILGAIQKYKTPLEIAGTAFGGIEHMRQDAADRKQRQQQIDNENRTATGQLALQEKEYALQAARVKATQDAFAKLYGSTHYVGAPGAGGAPGGQGGIPSGGTMGPPPAPLNTPPMPSNVPGGAPRPPSAGGATGSTMAPEDEQNPSIAQAILRRVTGQGTQPQAGYGGSYAGYGGY